MGNKGKLREEKLREIIGSELGEVRPNEESRSMEN